VCSSDLLRQALQAGLDVNTAQVAAEAQARGAKGPQIGDAIHMARANAVAMAI